MKSILLVHGISSEGEWQEHIRPILQPFFKVVHIRYPQFRRLGPICVIAEPWMLLVALLLAVCNWSWANSYSAWFYVASFLLAVASCLPIAVAPRRQAAMNAYMKQAGDFFNGRPHLIAHSWGTYLSIRLLREYEDVEFDRIVLVGCVLPRNLNWRDLRGRLPLTVLNDWTTRDWIPSFARLAGLIHKGLGSSGRHGFRPSDPDVHDMPKPATECIACAKGSLPIVHNVDCSPYGHSGKLLVRSHATRYWLPFFLRIATSEYEALRNLSLDYKARDHVSDFKSVAALEQTMQTRKWSWLFDQTLYGAMARRLQEFSIPPDAEAVSYALRLFALAMGSAFEESCANENALHNLDPHQAIRLAVVEMRNRMSGNGD